MTVDFRNIPPGTKIIELGGGDNPHPSSQVNVDVRPGDKVSFVVDFETENWPIQSEEWDVVFSHFAMEHVSFTKIPQFLKEVFRILSPGGKAIIITANTEAQIKWIKDNIDSGWDSESPFVSCSKILFGSQDYGSNAHKSFFSPKIAKQLFEEAGFINVNTVPYGARSTDLAIEAMRPASVNTTSNKPISSSITPSTVSQNAINSTSNPINNGKTTKEERISLFDRQYFDGGTKVGGYPAPGYLDFPFHEITARHVLARNPQSVLELGCGRGYVLKRIQDHGIPACGVDISQHCWMTRATNNLLKWDVITDEPSFACDLPTTSDEKMQFDLAFSINFLEHISEEYAPSLVKMLEKHSKRGLHGISLDYNGFDRTQCNIKSLEWWQDRLPRGHEVFNKKDLEEGNFPADALMNDGLTKIAVGGFTTMYHWNWLNLDSHDLGQYAQQGGYRFVHYDVNAGLPFGTDSVDAICLPFFLQRLDYRTGLAFLRDCRRVIKGDGVMRLSVPDFDLLNRRYCLRDSGLEEFDHINEECSKTESQAAKFWALVHAGHSSAYDWDAVQRILYNAGWGCSLSSFRQRGDTIDDSMILKQTMDLLPCLGMYVSCSPN